MARLYRERVAARRLTTYVVTFIALTIAGVFVQDTRWVGSIQVHTLMETAATLLALIVGALALVRFYSRKDNTFLFVGAGFLGTGLLDGYHALVTSSAFSRSFPSPPPSLVPWSWLASRLFLSVLLWLSWVFWMREERLGERGRVAESTVYRLVGLWTLTCFCFFAFVRLPTGYEPIPVFHRPQEFVPALFFLLALIGYLRKGRWKYDAFEHWLVLSILIGFIGQAVFMSTSDRLYDLEFDTAHLLKKLSYLCALAGLVIAIYHLFRAEESTILERTAKLVEEIAERKRVEESTLALLGREQAALQRSREELGKRRRAEEALRDSEARFRSLVETANDWVCEIDAEARFTYCSPKARDLLGYAPEELIGRRPTELIVPEERSRVAAEIARHRGGQIPFSGHLATHVRKDGGRVVLEISGRPFLGPDGRPAGVRVIARDVTARKQAEDALRASERRYRRFVERNAAGILRTTLDGEILECNDSLAAMLGYASPSELRQHRAQDTYVDTAERAALMAMLQQEGAVSNHEVRLRRKDGTGVWALVNETLVEGEGGEGDVVEASVIDITERKRAEQALRLQATALESAANAIVITDAEGTIQWANPAFTHLTGYALEEAVGQNPRLLKSDFQDEAFYKRLWDTILAGQAWHAELINRRKDGRFYTEEMTIAPVRSADGRITNFVAIKQDVTERKRIESELVRAKDLAESASRTKSEFLANMSHELRTPLNGILGMADLVLDTDLTTEQLGYLGMLKASGDSLLAVINDLLDFSRIEAGKLDFESIAFNLRSSVEATTKTLALRAHEKGLELNCRVRPEVPAMVVGDPGRLRQILINLVSNAIKFTAEGEVTVEVEQRSVQAGSTLLHFAVSDTGIGIPEDKRSLILEAFTQADASTARRFGGSGLGLAIARRLALLFGGELWLESEVGRGSTFHFTACLGVGESATDAAPVTPPDLAGIPVLVVDDNATNRAILAEILTSLGMAPVTADGARSAVHCLEQAANAGICFRLLLVDARMPEIDGFSFIEQVRGDPRLAVTTIMMLTSVGRRGDAARCRELGVAAYLVKPIGRSELCDAIVEVLGRVPRPEERPPVVTRHSLREEKRGVRILLAEDNLVNRTVGLRLLEKHGYRVETALDGNDALRKVELGSIDLVLMDVQMPGMDGFQATAAIRERERAGGGHVPIIALTAHAMKGDRERCLAAGMDGYISKPIQIAELLKEIERVGGRASGRCADSDQEPADAVEACSSR